MWLATPQKPNLLRFYYKYRIFIAEFFWQCRIFLALIISFSRIVVGAHYLTDIIGGIAVAFIGFKLSKLIIVKILNINNNNYFIINNNFILVIFFFILLAILLTVGPSLDIHISNFFYLGKKHYTFDEWKAEIQAEKIVTENGLLPTTDEDVKDEFKQLEASVEDDPIDEDDENQIDMDAISPHMRDLYE